MTTLAFFGPTAQTGGAHRALVPVHPTDDAILTLRPVMSPAFRPQVNLESLPNRRSPDLFQTYLRPA